MNEDLRMAEELDGMEEDTTSVEATFLEKILKKLRVEETLNPKEKSKLMDMYRKYIDEEAQEEEKGAKGTSDDVEEDDFVS